MNINKHPNLEDLLKVKKAEQPDDIFWEKFDRDLQEKTLQTFIEQEPWYHNVGNLVSQYARSASMATGLVLLMGVALFLNTSLDRTNTMSDMKSQDDSQGIVQGASGWKSGAEAVEAGWEQVFSVDLNGNKEVDRFME